ncbi:MAG: right-handed parallel beta-helix repeat-containing protein, partial [Actinobacteria bacterium]|nr:right-handed parallel beta-helix repeat-containing protein [Actinomycetota bacterium]
AVLGDGIVLLNSAANHITSNTVAGNGAYDGIGVLGRDSDDNTVEANTVRDTVGQSKPPGAAAGQGIFLSSIIDFPDPEVLSGNVVVGNTVEHNASAGISNVNNADGRIADNTVEYNGVVTNANGNGIGVTLGQFNALDHVLTGLLIENNHIHHNAFSGLEIGAGGNRVLDNDASDNTVTPTNVKTERPPMFDLHDSAPDCHANTWAGNTWGVGSYSPECTTAGGTGPSPPATPVRPHPHPPADFAGKWASDVSVFRPDSGAWYVAGGSTTGYGTSGDIAVPADYDGDGHADTAVYRPSVGAWYIHNSATDTDTVVNYGLAGDLAVPADYDGDGRADVAVYRPDSGTWYIHQSSTNADVVVNYGLAGDIPVPGDYNGDGRADVAVYRPAEGGWYV